MNGRLSFAAAGVLMMCSLLVPVREAGAQTKQIVLGENSQVLKQPIKPGAFDLQLVNVLNDTKYTVESETTSVSIVLPEPLPKPAAAGDACDTAIVKFQAAVKKATTEEAVAAARSVALGEAPDDACKKKINELSVLNVAGGPFEVEAQQDITFTIKRPNQGNLSERDFGSYKFATTRKQPGTWLTLYGVNYIDSGDDEFFAKTGAGTPVTYTITGKADRSERDFAPSVYFMWVKERNHSGFARALSWNDEDVFGGITAGIGFDFDNPTAFLGYGVGWGYNVLLTAGVAMHKEKRLNGRYQPGEVITENLSEDQLAEETYKPRAYVGIAFRFGSNPFKKETPAPAATP